jgi:glycosyltransferase involved in cell wall biosynthesis/tetratricopeptide (TPR) repeat protein
MPSRLLIGPVEPSFADRYLSADRDCLSFDASAPGWAEVTASFPPGWVPDALLVHMGYTSVPAWVWSAPVPVIALAPDPNLLWHRYRSLLPLADLVLTDRPAVDRFRRAGLTHARSANLNGLDRDFLAEVDTSKTDRDIDVLFVGNLHLAIHEGRLPWLGRLARLVDRHRVVIATGVFGADYRALLRRAKLVFNRSIRGECNKRALEAAAGGAILLQESDNEEVPRFLKPEAEYVPYTANDLEARIAACLADDSGRQATAARARARVRGCGWLNLVRTALAECEPEWHAVLDRAACRIGVGYKPSLVGRVWQRASLNGPDADPTLAHDVVGARDDHGQGLFSTSPEDAEQCLARAAVGNRVSALGYAAVLLGLGREVEAGEVVRCVLFALDADGPLTSEELTTCPYPVRFDHLRVGWERAGWNHPDDPAAEAADKLALIRCWANMILAQVTGDRSAYAAAVVACPDLPVVRAALGCALARAGLFDEAIGHLTIAVEANPFDAAAAAALIAALTDASRADEAAAVREDRRRLAQAALGLVPNPEPAERLSRTQVVSLTPDEFARRFGCPEAPSALCGFTPPADTRLVLALVAHLHPHRVLEVGTAAGHMTANLTAWTPPGAVVYSVGVIAEDGAGLVVGEQGPEVPPRAEFARFVNHFGTGHKAALIAADSRVCDFGRFAPLDFAFIDGGHDFETARSDSRKAYAALRPGGCLVWHDFGSSVPWVRVREAVESSGFAEPIHHVTGTGVAFLFKADRQAGESPQIAIAWDGEFEPVHSLAGVNRAVCAELAAQGHQLALIEHPSPVPGGGRVDLTPELRTWARPLSGPADAYIRHRWPADLTPPGGGGAFVLVQPWEFGRIPRAWVGPILDTVDEVWAYSRAVERAYVASGIPADRVKVVPLGVDADRFRPGLLPLPLRTAKRVKLLFVGGTIWRKGFDVLLTAYLQAFRATDDVCLVVKDVGVASAYRGQTAGAAVAAVQANADTPEVEYITDDLPEADLARLYAACDVLVLPSRGEGFGLPVLEAMACGLPVVVTAGGATDDFVPPAAGWRIPARVTHFPENRVGDFETVGRPWYLEPDVEDLVAILRAVVSDPAGRAARGAVGRRTALGWTWARTAAAVEDRVRQLRGRTPLRFRQREPEPIRDIRSASSPIVIEPPAPFAVRADAVPTGRQRVSLCMIVKNEEHNLPDCIGPVRDLFDEVIVVDTGSIDRTREVARALGATVVEFPWVDSFSAARNESLRHATGDWVFWLDADDRLDVDNRARLARLFAELRLENAACVLKCACVSADPGGPVTVVDHVRLFRNDPRVRWTYRVHEQILPALRRVGADVRWADVTIWHVGYTDPTLRRRKLDRDMRLLLLERVEQPDDPFTLFNLGSVLNELGDVPAALSALERSLALSHPTDSIVRKLYALIARGRRVLGDHEAALAACREGREHYPDDAELLFTEAGLLREAGDAAGAESALRRLLGVREKAHFASVDAGLRGYKARHLLAEVLLEQGKLSEAEAEWEAVVAEAPRFVPGHVGLAEVCRRRGDEAGLAWRLERLAGLGPAEREVAEAIRSRLRG